jgi:hypothetical protein
MSGWPKRELGHTDFGKLKSEAHAAEELRWRE